MGTKGTWRRDAAVTDAEITTNWERTFGRKGIYIDDHVMPPVDIPVHPPEIQDQQ